jgi:hypothetical protein
MTVSGEILSLSGGGITSPENYLSSAIMESMRGTWSTLSL